MKRQGWLVDRLPGGAPVALTVLLIVMVVVTAVIAVSPPTASAASVNVEVTSPSRADTINSVAGIYEVLWLDANKADAEGPRGSWISFIISNPDTETDTLYDLEVTMGPFTDAPGAAGQASLFVYTDDPTRKFSELAPGESVAVYYYVDYAGVRALTVNDYTDYTADYTLEVTASTSPGGASAVLHSETRHVVTDELLSAAAAGICQTVDLGPGIYVGQQYTMTVGYEFGNNKDIFFMPAGEANFNDHVYRLVDAQITWVNPNEIVNGLAVGDADRLHYPDADIKDNDSLPSFEVTYLWEVISTDSNTQTVNPWAAAKSGNRYKYQGFNTALTTTLDGPTLPLTVTKSVDPDWMLNTASTTDYGTAIVKYTVVFTNIAGVPITLSSIEDILPLGVSIEDAIYWETPPTDGVRDWYVTEAKTGSSPADGATSDPDGDGTADTPVSWVGLYVEPGGDNEYVVPAALDADGDGEGDDVDGTPGVDEPGTLTLQFLADASQCEGGGDTTMYYTNEVYGLYGGASDGSPQETDHAYATFQIGGTRTLAVVSDLDAYAVTNGAAIVWETISEAGTAGYYIERFDDNADKWKKVQTALVPALLESPTGGVYSVVDHSAKEGQTYTYRVVEVELDGTELIHGPYEATVGAALQDKEVAEELVRGQGVARIPELPAQASTQAQTARGKGLVKKAGATLIRIEVAESGLYEVSASDIADGLGLSGTQVSKLVKNGGLSLTTSGKAVAYLPATDGSGLYFYGQAVDSLYAANNVYWLTQGKGVIMSDARPVNVRKAATTITEFVDTVHAEENTFAYPELTDDPEADIWMWTYVFTGTPQTLTVEAPAATEGVELDVTLWGLIDLAHRVEIQLNGVKLGDVEWSGSTQTTATLAIPEGVLVAGSNEVTLVAKVEGSNPYDFDVLIVESFDLTYERTTLASSGTLLLEAPATAVAEVTGLGADEALVLDLTNALWPRMVESMDASDAVTEGLAFNAQRGRDYFVSSMDDAQRPAAMTATVEPTLTDAGRGAEYVVITAPALLEAAERFAAYRESQGFETAVVTTSEIYDEFNYGIADPQAVQSFMKLIVTKWKPETEYVLLAGEGSLDYKDYLGNGDCLVPSVLIDGNGCLVPSDSALADVLGQDGLSEVAIGRVPAQTAAELDAYLAKVTAYEAATGDWRQSVLLATDDPDRGGDFYAHSDAIGEALPSSLDVTKAYLGESSLTETRASIKAAFTDGSLLVSYVGHATSGQLASEGLLTKGMVASLPTISELPIVTAYSCFAGYYGVPGYDGLAESLVNKAGAGSIAVWAPGGMEFSVDSTALGSLFAGELFGSSRQVILGDVIQAAKAAAKKDGLSSTTLQDYGLLGDPALRVTW